MSRYVRQINPRQEKSVKFTPISEGGLGLSPGLNNDDIKKPKQNVQAKYWYDKYEELVKEVSYHRKMDRQNLTELEDKVVVINEGLLDEIASINNSDPLAPLEKKFVTLDKLAEHYKLFLSRIQEQIATIGGGGAGILADLDDVDASNRGHKTIIMYNDVTKKYEFTDPDMDAGISNEDDSGDEIILNGTTSAGADESGSIQQENKTRMTNHLTVGTVTSATTFEDDVTFKGATSNLTWDASANDLEFDDDSRLKFGDGDDFQIWHGGTHTFMKNNTGELRIRGDIISLERENDLEKYLECNVNEDVKLFYNGNEKFATTNTGVSVTGNVVISNDGNIGSVGDTDSIAIDSSGNITASQNVTFTGDAANAVWDKSEDRLEFADDAKAIFGNASGGDLRIFHSGGNSTIKNVTGQFRLAGNDIRLQTQNHSEDFILCTDGGAVTLYYNDSAKLATTNTGVTVTGDAKVGTSQAAGVILTSPDATEYRLIVANDGTLSTSAV